MLNIRKIYQDPNPQPLNYLFALFKNPKSSTIKLFDCVIFFLLHLERKTIVTCKNVMMTLLNEKDRTFSDITNS